MQKSVKRYAVMVLAVFAVMMFGSMLVPNSVEAQPGTTSDCSKCHITWGTVGTANTPQPTLDWRMYHNATTYTNSATLSVNEGDTIEIDYKMTNITESGANTGMRTGVIFPSAAWSATTVPAGSNNQLYSTVTEGWSSNWDSIPWNDGTTYLDVALDGTNEPEWNGILQYQVFAGTNYVASGDPGSIYDDGRAIAPPGDPDGIADYHGTDVIINVPTGIGSAAGTDYTIYIVGIGHYDKTGGGGSANQKSHYKQAITLKVFTPGGNAAPTFTSTAVTTATEGVAYTYNITTNDTDNAGTELTITAVTKPAWLTLTDNGDGTATLSGTPGAGDVGGSPGNDVTLRVSDLEPLSTDQSFTVTVSAAGNDAPVATNNTITVTEDVDYTFALTEFTYTDTESDPLTEVEITTLPGAGTLWYDVNQNSTNDDAALSAGATIPAADVTGGWLTYLPVADSTTSTSFTFNVSDGVYGAAAATMTINFTAVNDAPTFTSAAVTTATEGVAYTYNITTNDIDNVGADLTITAVTKPAWLTLTDNGDGTATLSGTPSAGDVGGSPANDVTLRVSDLEPLSTDQSFTVTVSAAANNPPDDPSNATFDQLKIALTSITRGTYTDESTVNFEADVSDTDGDQVLINVEIHDVAAADWLSPVVTCSGSLVDSGLTASAQCTAIPDGEYKWRLQAEDSVGATSNWVEF